jgi:tRNA (adenine57-N1/adenine58-N1)-methyltransferase
LSSEPRRGPLAAGERVLLVDRKGRRYVVKLEPGGSLHTHAGIVDHDRLIGAEEGVAVAARQREAKATPRLFIAIRPTLADTVLKMPRGAQVIYPKDIGAILVAADVYPGARVLEAGVGSGALTLALLRAGADVLGYEQRADFAEQARRNVAAFLGGDQQLQIEEGDVYEGVAARGLDRVLLDLPEPWRMIGHAEEALRAGGIFCAYLPGINQTAELRAGLERSRFGMAETFELLRRTWHIEGRSVRPDHRMVAHTGFITTARLLGEQSPGDPPAGDELSPAR